MFHVSNQNSPGHRSKGEEDTSFQVRPGQVQDARAQPGLSSLSPLVPHHRRQIKSPRHTQDSYQLTEVQAPGTPDVNSAESSQLGREGGEGGGGLEPIYFPAVMPIPAVSSLPRGVRTAMARGLFKELSMILLNPRHVESVCLGQLAICILFSIPTPVSPALWPICPAEGEACKQRTVSLFLLCFSN